MRKTGIVVGLAMALVLLLTAWDFAVRPVAGPHGRLELAMLRSADSLPVMMSTYFATSGRCAGCHGFDPQGLASIDAQGRDVNVADDWRSTMMANSARDPFFRAKIQHESLVNPAHADALQNKCLGCHAPLGMHEERLLGHVPFTLAHLDTSVLGLDGASCLSCHMQSEATAGSFFSGELDFDSARVYGPYADDQINAAIMEFFVRFRPGYGSHIVNSKVCAGCHTLITETADLDGNLTGDRFVEQATYHEWLNSVYSANGTQCNTCHMPRINDGILLAAEYPFLNPQSPFGLHHLVGGNEHMLRLLKQNKAALAIPASDTQFDSTLARTRRMLAQQTLDLSLALIDRTADTAYFAVRLENKAGHRFPSGYPSRRAFIEFAVITAEGDTVFKSGVLDSADELEGHDTPYEPHYDVITSSGQVQIYEMVMGDVNGDVTTVLERAKEPIKDNRLAPVGFTSTHFAYDTTRVAGVPASDLDFNRNAFGDEGTGADAVSYHVPITGVPDALRAFARVWYQPVPPGWNAEMFSHSHPDIDAFRDMLAASDRSPSIVASDSLFLGPAGIAERPADLVRVHPVPTSDGWVGISARGGALLELLGVMDARGAQTHSAVPRSGASLRVQLPDARGTYLLLLRVNGAEVVKRAVRE
jgi:hypothetical protein